MNFIIKTTLYYSPPQSAYEDKQHSKRKEISSRPWFRTTSATPGGTAGSLLHKLGLQGKEAAVAKTLGSSHSPLIRKRTGVKTEPCATIARRQSHPEISTCDGEISEVTQREKAPSSSPAQMGQEATERHIRTTDEADEGLTEATEQDKTGAVTSLVVDYSDSDSDPGQ